MHAPEDAPLPNRSTLLPTAPPDTPISARAADRRRGKHSQSPLADPCIPTPPANCAADATNPPCTFFLPSESSQGVIHLHTCPFDRGIDGRYPFPITALPTGKKAILISGNGLESTRDAGVILSPARVEREIEEGRASEWERSTGWRERERLSCQSRSALSHKSSGRGALDQEQKKLDPLKVCSESNGRYRLLSRRKNIESA